MDPSPVLAAVVDDVRAGAQPTLVAARFHAAVADIVLQVCVAAREQHSLHEVALTGGVFANTLLSSRCARTLNENGFTVLRHREVPRTTADWRSASSWWPPATQRRAPAQPPTDVRPGRAGQRPPQQGAAMCLAVPGRVMDVEERDGTRMATVDFGGVVKEVCLEYLPDLQVGEYAIVHVGFALQRLDEESARKTLELFAELGLLQEEFGDSWERAAEVA